VNQQILVIDKAILWLGLAFSAINQTRSVTQNRTLNLVVFLDVYQMLYRLNVILWRLDKLDSLKLCHGRTTPPLKYFATEI
jgi:hypothetical protein